MIFLPCKSLDTYCFTTIAAHQRVGYLGVNTVHSIPGRPRLESRSDSGSLAEVLCGSSQSLETNSAIIPKRVPSKFFLVHHSLAVLPCDTTDSVIE
jgi:hypothetical protein